MKVKISQHNYTKRELFKKFLINKITKDIINFERKFNFDF
jgi:hypothetical protein